MGSALGALLADDGHEVQFVARGARAKQLADRGLRINGLADLKLECNLVTDLSTSQSPDLLIVAVKTYSHLAAVESMSSWRPKLVISVANGVSKNEDLVGVFGAAATLGCVADFSAELLTDGNVAYTRNVGIHLGELAPTDDSERVASLVRTLQNASIRSQAHADVARIEWSKFVGWCPFMALSIISRGNTWQALADPNLARTLVVAGREMAALASTLGVAIEDFSPLPVATLTRAPLEEAVTTLAQMGERFRQDAVDHRMSALQDFERGSPLETEETLGHALALGRDAGVPMPTMRTLYDLVTGLDRLRDLR